MCRCLSIALVASVTTLCATAQISLPTGFTSETVYADITFPGNFATDMEFLPDGRMVVVTKGGFVLLVPPSGGSAAAIGFLLTEFTGERGISGVAVDPGFSTNGYIYLHYAPAGSGIARVSRFTLLGDLNDATSTNLVMVDEHILVDNIQDTDNQHGGGGMAFGTDGMLYSAQGDDRVDCAATDRTNALGTLLRMDVAAVPPGPGGPATSIIVPADNPFVTSSVAIERLVAAWGLRQPFTMEVDEVGQRLYIGDVGNGTSEEIDCFDMAPAGGHAGINFGWPEMEGTFTKQPCVPGNPIPPLDHEPPIYEILHVNGAVAIMLMTRYRNSGRLLDFGPGYEGDLFFCDWGTGNLQRIREDTMTGTWNLAPPAPGQPSNDVWGAGFFGVAKWKRGPDGALYYLLAGPGEIGRIRPEGLDHEIICEPTLGVPGSIDIAFRGVGGGAGNGWFYGLAVDHPGVAPNGWFFGIDMTFVEIQTQINLFVGLFDGLGQFELRATLGALPCPLGLTVDAVLLEIGANGLLVGQGPAKTLNF